MHTTKQKTTEVILPITKTEYSHVVNKKYNNQITKKAFDIVAKFHLTQKKDITKLNSLITEIKTRQKISNSNLILKIRNQLII